MTIEELKVLITAETAGLEKELGKVKSQLGSFEKSVTKSTNKISSSFKNLFKGISFVAIAAGLYKIGKAAVQTASDLQEVENVVSVSFGAAADEIDRFAKSALKSFGLSELTAKKAASTFMAMSNGMGVATDAGKTMAVELTKLTGDLSSFWNVSQDVAQTALASVYTGETESLKKFGIVMTDVNLQQFALSQGITKQVSAMSQAEKVMLRYNYVMAQTAQAQGDFARTGGSWANQVKLLKEQWSQLLGILGQALTKVLLPIVQALNNMLAAAISVANALSKAFGFSGIKSATTNVETAAAGADSLGGSLDGANTSAKALQKTLGSFDELNVMADNSASGGGESGGGGMNVGSTITGTGDVVEEETSYAAERFRNFVNECKEILEKWIATIPKLELNFDKERALNDLEGIGKNILNTIAGWGSFIITLAINVANDLDIGALANEVLSLFESFTGLASTITNVVQPALLNFYDIALKPIVEWIGVKVKDAIAFAKEKLDDWKTWFEENGPKINEFVGYLAGLVAQLWLVIEPISDAAWETFKILITGLNEALQILLGWILDNKEAVGFLAQAFLGLKLADLIIGFKGLWTSIKSGYGIFPYLSDLIKAPFQLLSGNLTSCTKKVTSVIKTLSSSILTFGKDMFAWLSGGIGKVGAALKTFSGAIANGLAAFLTSAKGALAAAGTAIKTGLTAALTAVKSALSAAVSWIVANPIAIVIAAIVALVVLIATKGDEIKAVLQKVNDWLQGIFAKDWTEVFGVFGNIVNGFFAAFKGVWDGVKLTLDGVIDLIRGVFTGDWKRAWEGVKEIFAGVFNTLAAVAKAPLNMVIGFLNTIIQSVGKAVNFIVDKVNGMSFKVPDWVPVIGGSNFGFNLKRVSWNTIPYLADGGVITSPTLAMMGEYAGARNNPEIVAPQSILKETMAASNEDLIDTLIQLNRQLIAAIDNKDMNLSITDGEIAASVKRSNMLSLNRTGYPLLSY